MTYGLDSRKVLKCVLMKKTRTIHTRECGETKSFSVRGKVHKNCALSFCLCFVEMKAVMKIYT